MFRFVIYLIVIALSQGQNVQYQWKYLNFTWPSTIVYNRALSYGFYIPENNIITGIKVWKNRLFLTLPRWKNGVPATLVVTSTEPINNDISPLLEPYPNWEMQQLDNCWAFQFVQSMEIDPRGRMWVLDNGRSEFMTQKTRTKCPPRLVILDLERKGAILLNYVFPKDVVNGNSVFINDIVLDHENGGWAYITDSDLDNPGIVVFSLRDKTSWKVKHETMKPKEEASFLNINGVKFTSFIPVDGIALSPASTAGSRTLYYTPISSYEIYCIPVNLLKYPRVTNVDEYVRTIGKKSSQSDGMMMSASGILYFGLLTENAVGFWNSETKLLDENYDILVQDRNLNQWPDTFAIDEYKQLWWTTNRIQNFMTNAVDIFEWNYRVIRSMANDKSYLYYTNGSCPEFPPIYY